MDHFSFLSIYFPIYLIIFCFSIFFSFYLPGELFFRHKKIDPCTRVLLSIVIGIVLWGFQGYIFGYLHIRFLTYVYIAIIVYVSLRKKIITSERYKEIYSLLKKNKLGVLFVGICIMLQLVPIFSSGMLYDDGVRFVGVNSTDGVMHLAFIQSMTHYFPPVEPGSFSNPLTNYHYWSDLIMSEIARIWRIPVSSIFFQFFPLVLSALTSIAAYQLVRKLGFSSKAGYASVFLLFFGGDLTYLLMFFVRHTVSFSTPGIDNGVTQFLNMPNAFARPIFITGVITLLFWLKEKSPKWGIATILIFASLFGVKIYYGIFVFIGMTFILLYKAIQIVANKKINIQKIFWELYHDNFFILYFLFIFISFLIYFPPNKMSGGLGWYPLEWPKIFLGADVLNWGDWWNRHLVYEQAHNIKGIIFLDSIAILIALLSIHGTRLLGIFSSISIKRKSGFAMFLFIVPGILIFHILGLFTLQSSGGLNVFNFFVVSTVLLSIMLGVMVDTFPIKSKIVKVLFFILVVGLTVPRAISELVGYSDSSVNPKKYHLISNDEVQAFEYIKKNTHIGDIVQSHPANPVEADTPYVSFFTDRPSYLSGVRLQITHNQPIEKRSEMLQSLFSSTDSPTFFAKSNELDIKIFYLQKKAEQRLKFNPDKNLIIPIFENNSTLVYKISDN